MRAGGDDSQLTDLFKARTASLCSHRAFGILNQTQRIDTSRFFASSTHSFLPSASGLVLSAFRLDKKMNHTLQTYI